MFRAFQTAYRQKKAPREYNRVPHELRYSTYQQYSVLQLG